MVDAKEYGSKARFINHSCDPNCLIEIWKIPNQLPVLAVFSSSHIKKGEELTWDYKWDCRKTALMQRCFCGTRRCVGIIAAKKTLPEGWNLERGANVKDKKIFKELKKLERRGKLTLSHLRCVVSDYDRARGLLEKYKSGNYEKKIEEKEKTRRNEKRKKDGSEAKAQTKEKRRERNSAEKKEKSSEESEVAHRLAEKEVERARGQNAGDLVHKRRLSCRKYC